MDADRLAIWRLYGVERAKAAQAIDATRLEAKEKAKQGDARDAAVCQELLTKLSAPGANPTTLMPEARRVVVGVSASGGPWLV